MMTTTTTTAANAATTTATTSHIFTINKMGCAGISSARQHSVTDELQQRLHPTTYPSTSNYIQTKQPSYQRPCKTTKTNHTNTQPPNNQQQSFSQQQQ
eukprot:m.24317 g.24317  ORF g.24317 m.24317 type:complete len:98 (+) comp14549_c0_seq1:97-390(+)